MPSSTFQPHGNQNIFPPKLGQKDEDPEVPAFHNDGKIHDASEKGLIDYFNPYYKHVAPAVMPPIDGSLPEDPCERLLLEQTLAELDRAALIAVARQVYDSDRAVGFNARGATDAEVIDALMTSNLTKVRDAITTVTGIEPRA
jgi:hypothetical protein